MGQALLRRGLDSEADLGRALETQVRGLLERMTGAPLATFGFSERHIPQRAAAAPERRRAPAESARKRNDGAVPPTR